MTSGLSFGNQHYVAEAAPILKTGAACKDGHYWLAEDWPKVDYSKQLL